jgi:hypothetical protein
MPVTGGEAVIAGVPGTGAPVQIETPIRNAPLRTGNPRDTLILDDGTQVRFSPPLLVFKNSQV